MSFFRADSSQRAVETILVGLLFILFDFVVGAGLDVIPDLPGWVLFAAGASFLSRSLVPAADQRFGAAARGAAWVMVPVSALVLLLGLSQALGLSFAALVPFLVRFWLLVASQVLLLVAVGALAAFLESYAKRYGADATTVKLLRASWIVSAVTLAVTLLVVAGLFPSLGFLMVLAPLAAGILLGVGLARCRNEGVVG